MLFGDGPKGNKFGNAGVGENDIDSPLHFRNGLVKAIKVGQFANVALNATNVAAECLHGLVEFLVWPARDADQGAVFYEILCLVKSNSFWAAGDDTALPFASFNYCFP